MQTFFPFHLLKWNSQNYHWASRPKWYPVKSRDLELGLSPCINNYPAPKKKKKKKGNLQNYRVSGMYNKCIS